MNSKSTVWIISSFLLFLISSQASASDKKVEEKQKRAALIHVHVNQEDPSDASEYRRGLFFFSRHDFYSRG